MHASELWEKRENVLEVSGLQCLTTPMCVCAQAVRSFMSQSWSCLGINTQWTIGRLLTLHPCKDARGATRFCKTSAQCCNHTAQSPEHVRSNLRVSFELLSFVKSTHQQQCRAVSALLIMASTAISLNVLHVCVMMMATCFLMVYVQRCTHKK